MLGGVTTQRDSLFWTLEEISHLVSHSGHPDETLRNIVQLIQRTFDTDVCSVYLLEPDRSTLVLAATVGLRPDSVGRVRMRLSEGLAGLVGEKLAPLVVEDATTHPRFKYFRRGWRRSVSLVSRRSARRQGTAARRARRPDGRAARVQRRCGPHAVDGRSAARLDREPGPHARAVRRAGTSEAGGARAQHVVELGSRHGEPVPSARSGALARARSQSHRAAPADTGRAARRARVGARAAQPHQLRVPPHAGAPHVDSDVGRAERGRALGATRRVFFGRVRPARIGSDLLGRPRHPRRRSPEGRVRSRHSARGHRAVLRPGIFHAAIRFDGLSAGGLPRCRQLAAAARAGDRRERPAGHVSASTRARARSSRACGSWPSAGTRSCCSIPTSTAISPRIAA